MRSNRKGAQMKKLMLAGIVSIASVAGPAVAADLPALAYKGPSPVAFNWSGCYLGGQIGAQQGRWSAGVNYVDPAAPASGSREFDAKGAFIGGAQMGCNYQPVASVFVIGVEGDILGAKNTADGEVFRSARTPTDHFDASGKIGSQGSLRLRLGAAWDRLLVYAAGGATWASIDTTHAFVRDGVGSALFQGSATRSGWNLGVGFDYAFAGGWTAGLEYRYTGYSSYDDTIPAAVRPIPLLAHTATAENVHTNDVRFRLNYLFGNSAVAGY
jgi:outer membrane immunogenic protein